MSVSLKINEEQDEFELEIPNSEDTVREDIQIDEESGDCLPVIVDPSENSPGYLVIPGNKEGFKSYSVYRLEPVDVVVELNAELDDEDDDEDEDEDEGDAE